MMPNSNKSAQCQDGILFTLLLCYWYYTIFFFFVKEHSKPILLFYYSAVLHHLNSLKASFYLSSLPNDTTVSTQSVRFFLDSSLSDISAWIKAHHLQLNIYKTTGLSSHSDSLCLVPTKVARNLGVMVDDQLYSIDHVVSVAQSCCFTLFNIRKIRPESA